MNDWGWPAGGGAAPVAICINAVIHINQKNSIHISRNVTIRLFNFASHVPIFLLGTHSVP